MKRLVVNKISCMNIINYLTLILIRQVDNTRWVARAAGKSVISNTQQNSLLEGKSVKEQIPTKSKGSLQDKYKIAGIDFPIPPGWDSLSTKSKKKELKKWHNHIRSKMPSAFVSDQANTLTGAISH